MTSIPKPLAHRHLGASLHPDRIPYADSREIPAGNGYSKFQPRAIQALELALRIKGNEYNIFVAGEANMGRTYFVRDHLRPAAKKAATPPDWLYLHNFDDADRPLAVSLTAGQGRQFKNAMSKALNAIRADLPAHFERDAYHSQHESLFKSHTRQREELFSQMEDAAREKNFRLDMDDAGALTLAPLVDGEPMEDGSFDKLPKKERDRLKREGDNVLSEISTFLRQINQSEKGLKRKELELQRAIAREVVTECLQPLRERFGDNEKLTAYLKAAEDDLVENVDMFLPKESTANTPAGAAAASQGDASGDDQFSRFEVNLFVDNGPTKGAPVVVEDHPTTFNLLGSIEREAELGSLYTDHTLIRPGSLHKANNGFLLLNTDDLLSSSSSWEGLLRALRAGHSRIEDPVDQEQARTRTIEPECIPLDLKIVLIGSDEHYEALLYHDDRFQKFFKLKAHMQSTAPRTMPNIRHYLTVLGRIVREAELLPFDRAALAGLVDFSSRLAEDQKKLSLQFPLVRERMIEASALAEMDGKAMVGAAHLREAVGTRDFRSNLFEEEYMGDYEREIIKVATSGQAVGRCNGLSVTLFGDYEFGLPHQISCTVGVGHGGILDLEREAQLGGPIHTKGMMILKSYLLGLFAQDKPIVMTGSLCFEQSYAGVEGDSASGAELAALLSALSGVPINLSYAFTGAVSQSGQIMAVGGVNRKVEGFFEVCRRHGLTGEQGVLIPKDNVANLMLRDDVLQAVENGTFRIYPVSSVEQAMRILTGMPVDRRDAKGGFATGTLYHAADRRLAEFARLARAYGAGGGPS